MDRDLVGPGIKHFVKGALSKLDLTKRLVLIDQIIKYLSTERRYELVANALRAFWVRTGVGAEATAELYDLVARDLIDLGYKVDLKDEEDNIRNFFLREVKRPRSDRLFVYGVMIVEALRSDFAYLINDRYALREAADIEPIFQSIDESLATGAAPLDRRKNKNDAGSVDDYIGKVLKIETPFPRELQRLFPSPDDYIASFIGYRLGSSKNEIVKTLIVLTRPIPLVSIYPAFTIFYKFSGGGKKERVRKSQGLVISFAQYSYFFGASLEVFGDGEAPAAKDGGAPAAKPDDHFVGFKVIAFRRSDLLVHLDVFAGLTLTNDRVMSPIASRIVMVRTNANGPSDLRLGRFDANTFSEEVDGDKLAIEKADTQKVLEYLYSGIAETSTVTALTMPTIKIRT